MSQLLRTQVSESHLEFQPGSEQADFHAGHCRVQFLGCAERAKLLDIAENDHFAILNRKFHDCLVNRSRLLNSNNGRIRGLAT